MEIHILTEFHLKMTMIGDNIAKKVILPQILLIFRPSLAPIWSKIANFERICNFYYLKRGNTSTHQVSDQNYPNFCFLYAYIFHNTNRQ